MPCYSQDNAPDGYIAKFPDGSTYASEQDCLNACAEGACCETDGTCNIKQQCECDTANGAVFAGVGETCEACACNALRGLPSSVTVAITSTPTATLEVTPGQTFFPGVVDCWETAIAAFNSFSGSLELQKIQENFSLESSSVGYLGESSQLITVACPPPNAGDLTYFSSRTYIELRFVCVDGRYNASVGVSIKRPECGQNAPDSTGFFLLPTYTIGGTGVLSGLTEDQVREGGTFSAPGPLDALSRVTREYFSNIDGKCNGAIQTPTIWEPGSTDASIRTGVDSIALVFLSGSTDFSFSYNPLP